jgi:hypothetical protein
MKNKIYLKNLKEVKSRSISIHLFRKDINIHFSNRNMMNNQFAYKIIMNANSLFSIWIFDNILIFLYFPDMKNKNLNVAHSLEIKSSIWTYYIKILMKSYMTFQNFWIKMINTLKIKHFSFYFLRLIEYLLWIKYFPIQ